MVRHAVRRVVQGRAASCAPHGDEAREFRAVCVGVNKREPEGRR